MIYNKDVNNFVSKIELIQDPNTIDGGECEELDITIHQTPVSSDVEILARDFFVVLKTQQWALDYDDIDKFADYLKNLIKVKLI